MHHVVIRPICARAPNIHLGQGSEDVSALPGMNHIAGQSKRSLWFRLMSPLEHMRLLEKCKKEE